MATFNLRQFGQIVASACCADETKARAEIMRYAAVYSQDGAVSVEGPLPDDWCPECGEKCECGIIQEE